MSGEVFRLRGRPPVTRRTDHLDDELCSLSVLLGDLLLLNRSCELLAERHVGLVIAIASNSGLKGVATRRMPMRNNPRSIHPRGGC